MAGGLLGVVLVNKLTNILGIIVVSVAAIFTLLVIIVFLETVLS